MDSELSSFHEDPEAQFNPVSIEHHHRAVPTEWTPRRHQEQSNRFESRFWEKPLGESPHRNLTGKRIDFEGETESVRNGSHLRGSATCDEQAAWARHRKCFRDGTRLNWWNFPQALEGAAMAPGSGNVRQVEGSASSAAAVMRAFATRHDDFSTQNPVPEQPSGVTSEYLRSFQDNAHSTNLFFRMGENLVRDQVLDVAVAAVRSGRTIVFSKDDGGVAFPPVRV